MRECHEPGRGSPPGLAGSSAPRGSPVRRHERYVPYLTRFSMRAKRASVSAWM